MWRCSEQTEEKRLTELGVNFHRALSCGILVMDRFVYCKIELITEIKTCTVASEGNDVHGGVVGVGWGGVGARWGCQNNKRNGRPNLLPAAY
jgi:hypothetical protein